MKDKKQSDKFEKLRKELNALPQIDYERVNDAKTEYLRLLFEQEGGKVLESSAFKKFFAETESWFVPYAQWLLYERQVRNSRFLSLVRP